MKEIMVTDSQEQAQLFGIHYSNKCNTDDSSFDPELFSENERLYMTTWTFFLKQKTSVITL